MRSRLQLTVSLAALAAQSLFAQVEIKTIPVRGSVSMLVGQGGNIGLLAGDDGVFMIDDQYAPLTDAIVEAIGKVSSQPIRFVINTHWHGDHTGGNENLGKRGAVIVAHDNVRKRMSSEQFMEAFQRTVPKAAPKALPVITFADSISFHWNGETVRIVHVPNAHTDGDSIVHFENANVIHTGDTYFNGFYPFIDPSSGGVIDGMITAADITLGRCNDDTQIIPGHGPLSNPSELRAFRDMLTAVRDQIQTLIDEGKSRDEVIAAEPSGPFDAEWGDGFLPPAQWVGLVYDGMIQSRAAAAESNAADAPKQEGHERDDG